MNSKGNVLISGASFAGLSTAFFMKKLGYDVTVVEVTAALKKGGTPVNIRNRTVGTLKRMDLFEKVQAKRLTMETTEFINAQYSADDIIAARPDKDRVEDADIDYEVERDDLLDMMFGLVKDEVKFIFGDKITSLEDKGDSVGVSFEKGSKRSFDLVLGCDGIHSGVRKAWFGDESQFSHFLKAYGSVSIVEKLLIKQNVSQMYNEPGKTVLINAYNGKTDIILIFYSEKKIPYDMNSPDQKKNIILENFAGVGWRTPELLEEVKQATNFYFGALTQIKMPSWTKGRVALVGDAGYCASPAAGMGGSLAIDGAAALYDAFEMCGGDYELAFREYNKALRPFIEEVQAAAEKFGVTFLVPRTVEAIRERFT